MAIHARWFSPSDHKTDKDKEQFERSIRNGTTALKRLKEIIEVEMKSLELPPISDYSEGWQFRQADRLGRLRAYKNLMKLLEFIDDRQ